jgi:hypothetical protein
MDSKQVTDLLERYWNCDTTLEEERQLRAYFQQSQVPTSHEEAAAWFRYLNAQRVEKIDDPKFDQAVTKQVQPRLGGKIITLPTLARLAAGLVVVAVATYFVRQEIERRKPAELEDTYSDPKLAFEETKKALMTISRSFGKAQREASRMKVFNEAENKIQGTKEEVEKETENI